MHYGSSNHEHFLTCLAEYSLYADYALTTHVFLTEDCDLSAFPSLNIVKHVLPASLGKAFVLESKPVLYESRNDYDYYIYSEDDVLITRENFETFARVQSQLPLPYACGFLRYELKPNDDYKYLLDNHPVHSIHRGGRAILKARHRINGLDFLEPYNVHQGCHVLTREMMRYLEKNYPRYFKQESFYAGILEGCASDVYFNSGLVKVVPVDQVEKLLVHHLADKYVNLQPENYTRASTPNEVRIKNVPPNFNEIGYFNVLAMKVRQVLLFLKLIDRR